ncbi:MAG: agmatine deiminase family protein [Dokdonella sp.]
MRKTFFATTLYFVSGIANAATPSTSVHVAPKQADSAYLATLIDDNPNPLPRGFSAEEQANFVPAWIPARTSAPPTTSVRAQAEYEPTDGILVRWGSFTSVITAMAVPLTTAAQPAYVYVVVNGTSQQASASSALAGAGTNMAYIRFITQPCSPSNACSVWMRDYGPRFINDGGHRGMVDHTYNRPSRTVDNAFPAMLASSWNEPRYAIPLVHGGGNFHLFRNRDAFMTRLIANENSGLIEQQIKDYYLQYEGLNLTLTDPFPTSYDSTQHIDMWMLGVGDNIVLIGEYAAGEGGGVPKTVTDNTAALMQSRGYTVYRTPGWSSSGTHYTYTNSVIVNRTALICRFGGTNANRDAQALATYQTAMPGYDIVAVDCSSIIQNAGAIHCIAMHVPDLVFRDGTDASIDD